MAREHFPEIDALFKQLTADLVESANRAGDYLSAVERMLHTGVPVEHITQAAIDAEAATTASYIH